MTTINLDKLNPSQKEAVTSINGVIQVGSCAGSGKTRVLTYRIAHMINDLNINPSSIMVATFTKKAASEMKERLYEMLTKQQVDNLIIGTFHSIGYRILKHEYTVSDDPLKNFKLLSGAPQQWLVKDIIKSLHISISNSFNENYFISEINNCKIKLITPDALSGLNMFMNTSLTERQVSDVFREYEKRKTEQEYIDFNDMLYKLYWMFNEKEDVLKKYQNQIKYILVDECQDCNEAQYELIKMIGQPENNIFIVGDDDQSIYKFRGAVPEIFINFKNQYDNVKVINLEKNYRSMPYILESANKLISHNEKRIIKKLIPFRKSTTNGLKIKYQIASDEDAEAEIISNDILELKDENKSFDTMAILYRTNAQSRALEDQLIANAIPYTIANGISFYERTEVKDIICYLRLAVNSKDNEAFERIINKPSRYLGAKFVENLKIDARIKKCSLFEVMKSTQFNGYVQNSVNNFIGIMETIICKIVGCGSKNESIDNVIKTIRKITKYDDYLVVDHSDEEDNMRIENLNSLVKAASRYNDVNDFLKYIDLITKSKNENIPTVKLMTIHKSKGLEFDNVFIAGMSQGILPHKHAIEDEKDIEEERRLAYVAITRAKEFIKVTSPMHFQNNNFKISDFIYEAEMEEVKNKVKELV